MVDDFLYRKREQYIIRNEGMCKKFDIVLNISAKHMYNSTDAYLKCSYINMSIPELFLVGKTAQIWHGLDQSLSIPLPVMREQHAKK